MKSKKNLKILTKTVTIKFKHSFGKDTIFCTPFNWRKQRYFKGFKQVLTGVILCFFKNKMRVLIKCGQVK